MKKLIFLLLVVVSNTGTRGQSVTKSDYDRAVGLLWDNVNNKKTFNLFVQPNWFADSSGVWYLIRSKEGWKYHQVKFKGIRPSGHRSKLQQP
jgi:hypothetical protein